MFNPDDHDPSRVASNPDYWYEHRHELQSGQVFMSADGAVVKLDGGVPGDGTKLYVANWWEGSWSYEHSTIEPGELRGLPLLDTPAAIAQAYAAHS